MIRERHAGKNQAGSPPLIGAVLIVTGFVYLLGTPLGVVLLLGLRLRQGERLDAAFLAMLLLILAVGVTLAALSIAVAALLRRPGTPSIGGPPNSGEGPVLDYYTDGLTARTARSPHGTPETSLATAIQARLLARVTEIRDIIVLGPNTSKESRERLNSNLQRIAAREIIDAINARRLGKARELLKDAEAVYGKTATLQRLHVKIDEAAKRNEPLDYAFTRRVVEEAIAAGLWDQAEQSAQALSLDHPDSVRGRRLWDDTRRARLHAHIQARARDHQWAEALAATEEFLERFPGSIEADSLRGQIATLRTNAEILRRKQYEAKFQTLIAGGHYAEALRIAQYITKQYPDSPQALALRDRIPLLEKRIAGR